MKKIIPVILAIITVLVVGISSYYSVKLIGGKGEEGVEIKELIVNQDMTLSEFGEKNSIPNQVLKEVFKLQSKSDLQKKLGEFNLSNDQITENIKKKLILSKEIEVRDWKKIFTKFILWFGYLIIIFFLMRAKKITRVTRILLYAIAFFVFGVILGSDPGPMGTVKDAIVLYGIDKVLFKPRLMAFIVFTLMVILANKFICAWGCQVGTLQDFIYRLNRNKKDNAGIIKQVKIPFVISNTVRFLFLIAIFLGAFIFSNDIVEPIDPFKIYKPQALGIIGFSFIGIVAILSLFIYRPWCHFFCPFGFTGWLFEKISLFKIKVNYETCIKCDACVKACPTNVMEAILKQNKKTIPDCFTCSTCIEICPTNSIQLQFGKRNKP